MSVWFHYFVKISKVICKLLGFCMKSVKSIPGLKISPNKKTRNGNLLHSKCFEGNCTKLVLSREACSTIF